MEFRSVAICAFSLAGALCLTSVMASGASPEAKAADWVWVYFGTYTKGESKGVYVAKLDLNSGKLDGLKLAAELKNPSFVTLHPTKPLLYACSELWGATPGNTGAISGFAIQDDGTLKFINQQSAGGPGTCHVAVDPSGQVVVGANFSGGSVASMPIDAAGKLGESASFIQHQGSSVNPKRQSAPHAHSVNFDKTGRIVMIADLGLDKVMVYRLDAKTGKLSPNEPPSVSVEPGSGPRHFSFHPNGRFAYLINELKSTINAYSYDADKGTLTLLQTVSSLPRDYEGGNSTAEILVHPSGRFVYGSNRGHNSIVAMKIDPESGKLALIGHQSTLGKTPRNFGIDPTGKFLLAANQDSNNVVVLKIDPQSGSLTETGNELKLDSPVCVRFRKPAE